MLRSFQTGPLILIAAVATPACAQALPGEMPLAPPELDALRGGFDLPDGLMITLGVTTDTRIDGREVLRTVFDVRSGASTLTVLANRADGAIPGLVAVDASTGAVRTADGLVRVQSAAGASRVELSGDRIDVSHLVGGALGSVIANGANDRSIDVATTVDIGLSGVSPAAIGGSLARIDSLVLDATTRMNQ